MNDAFPEPQSPDLNQLEEEALLNLRLCDLPVTLAGTWLEECINELYQELAGKNLVFRPKCYLADEWLSPKDEPVIGIPFFLAHPALLKLERKMMLEAEGEGKAACLKLLRHETGHAICHAYRLQQRRRWKDVFGSPSQEYADTYRFRPYSKNFVHHLDGFYAQVHPDEDFVETFAVWLTPGLDWKTRYRGWKALEKLEYLDRLMASIRGRPPKVATGTQHWNIRRLKMTLRTYYKKKRHYLAEDFPDFHDDNLRRIFTAAAGKDKDALWAGQLIRKYRKNIIDEIALWSGEKKYIIHNLLKTVTNRCQELKLAVRDPEPVALCRLTAYLTTLVMNYVYTGWYRGDKQQRTPR
jgi:hypothetical protein